MIKERFQSRRRIYKLTYWYDSSTRTKSLHLAADDFAMAYKFSKDYLDSLYAQQRKVGYSPDYRIASLVETDFIDFYYVVDGKEVEGEEASDENRTRTDRGGADRHLPVRR